jgi:OmpA-OmpF porin, OOP family
LSRLRGTWKAAAFILPERRCRLAADQPEPATVPLPETSASGLRRIGWLAGLPVLALVWASATLYAAPRVAERIEAAAASVAADTNPGTGEPWLRLEVRGRDLLAAGEAPDPDARARVLTHLAALEGPRQIVSGIGLVENAAPFQWAAIRTGPNRVSLEGSRPVEIGRHALEARVTGALNPGTVLDDAARAARGAPPDFASAAAFLAARLAGLAKGGRAALSDTVLSLSGEAVDVPAYEALRAALSDPPEGFSVGRIEILPPLVTPYRFVVEKTARGFALDGFAPSTSALEAARRAATEASAGGAVDDRLLPARGLDPAIDPKSLIAFAFRLADLLQAGRVAFADGAISVTGDAIDGQAIPDAEALLRDARPAGVKAGRVSLTAKPLSPYRVTLRRTADAVTLTGHVPDARTRERVLDALKTRLFREPVIDRLRLADGAPPDLGDALVAAIPLVTVLAAGEAAVSDRTLTLTGESLYREGAARAGDRLAEALPPGWTGRASVSARQPVERRDPDTCRADGAAVLAGADLRFPAASTVLTPAFYPTLDALAALTKACPALRITISGPADPAATLPMPAAGPAAPPAEEALPASSDSVRVASAAKAEDADKAGVSHGKAAGTQTAEKSKSVPAKDGQAKDGQAKDGQAKDGQGKDGQAKDGQGKKGPAKKEAAKETAAHGKAASKKPVEAPGDPPQDLPRLRAQAVIEYLLQAGARPNQVAPGPDGPAGPVAFALLP